MKKRIIFIIILFLLFTGGTFFAMQQKETAVKKEKDIAGLSTKETAESEVADVETKEEKPSSQLVATAKSFIACLGPDGKTAQASQDDCDTVWKFWNAQPKNAHVVNTSTITSTNISNNTSSNTASTPSTTSAPTQTPTVTPTVTITVTPALTETQQILPAIDSIELMDCTSSSCGHITTLQINGNNFTPDTIVQLVGLGWGTTYGEDTQINNLPDAMRVGGNGSTTIITDFYHLPCDLYMLRLVFPSLSDTASNADTLIIPASCFI